MPAVRPDDSHTGRLDPLKAMQSGRLEMPTFLVSGQSGIVAMVPQSTTPPRGDGRSDDHPAWPASAPVKRTKPFARNGQVPRRADFSSLVPMTKRLGGCICMAEREPVRDRLVVLDPQISAGVERPGLRERKRLFGPASGACNVDFDVLAHHNRLALKKQGPSLPNVVARERCKFVESFHDLILRESGNLSALLLSTSMVYNWELECYIWLCGGPERWRAYAAGG